MTSRGKLISRIEKSKSKAMARKWGKELNYLCRMLGKEARYIACISDDMFCDNISFAINAVSVVAPHIAHYLLYCVGYYETDKILKSIRRHDRKKLRGH